MTAALLALLLSASCSAAPKAAGKIKEILDDADTQVQSCVYGEALSQGAETVTLHAELTIRKSGDVSRARVDVSGASGSQAARVKACVEGALKALKFRGVSKPAVSVARDWTFKSVQSGR